MLEDYPLSAALNCLFNLFAELLSTCVDAVSSIQNVRILHAIVKRDSLNEQFQGNMTADYYPYKSG